MQPSIFLAVAMAGVIATSAPALARQPQTPPPTIRTLVLTEEATKSFGAYKPVAAPVLTSGDSIHLYGEPGDFGWHAKSEGVGFNVVAIVEVRGSNGRITGKTQPRPLLFEAPSQPGNFFFSLSVKVEGAVGAYTMVVRLRDGVSGQVVERALPFTLAKRRPAPLVSEPKPTPTQVTKSATPGERQGPRNCKQYFPEVGEMLSVQCPQ